jgi:glucose-6-phosphate-specific signal transduction histidine kinase
MRVVFLLVIFPVFVYGHDRLEIESNMKKLFSLSILLLVVFIFSLFLTVEAGWVGNVLASLVVSVFLALNVRKSEHGNGMYYEFWAGPYLFVILLSGLVVNRAVISRVGFGFENATYLSLEDFIFSAFVFVIMFRAIRSER